MPSKPKVHRPKKKAIPTAKPRGTACQRGYDRNWRKARAVFLANNPLCAECLKGNKVTPATVVDHVQAHRGDRDKFWTEENWQSLCEYHHNQKTARGE